MRGLAFFVAAAVVAGVGLLPDFLCDCAESDGGPQRPHGGQRDPFGREPRGGEEGGARRHEDAAGLGARGELDERGRHDAERREEAPKGLALDARLQYRAHEHAQRHRRHLRGREGKRKEHGSSVRKKERKKRTYF